MKIGSCIVVFWLTAITTSLFPLINAICDAPTDLIITKRTGTITSNDVGQYNDNQNCVWQFRNHEEWNVARIVLDPYDIKSTTKECSEDYLAIDGFRYCGKKTRSTCIILSKIDTNITSQCKPDSVNQNPECKIRETKNWPPSIHFKANQAITAKGFSLSYSFHRCKHSIKIPVLTGRKSPDSKPPITTASSTQATTPNSSDQHSGGDFTVLVILILLVIILMLAGGLIFVIFRRRRKATGTKILDEDREPSGEPVSTSVSQVPGGSQDVNDSIYESIPESQMVGVNSHGGPYGMVSNVLYQSRPGDFASGTDY